MENIREHGRQRAPMYSDDDLMPLLQELHIPTYSSDDYILDMFSIVEKLINRATDTIDEGTKEALSEDDEIRKTQKRIGSKTQEIIGSVSCQVTREILNGNDAHTVTIGVLKYLRSFSWQEKLMFTLTAFGITFGDFWLLVRNYANNAINEPMTADHRELTSSANKDAYKFQIEANNDFIKTLLNTTEHLLYVIYLLLSCYVQEFFVVGEGPTKSNRFPIYVYWIMRGAIVAATQIIILSSRGLDQYLVGISYPKEFDKLKSLNQELMLKFSEFEDRASKWRNFPRLDTHSDVVEMMKTVIKPEKDLHPLYHSLTNRKDNLDVLNGKRVLLLISGLKIASEDIANLKHVTIDSETDVIVWIPIIKHSISDDVKNQLETLQNSMPWYSIHQPSLIEDGAIEAFRVSWEFKDRPILVVLSPWATALNKNAIFMVRIWQNLPVDSLSSEMEQQLWEKQTWNLKFLINDIDPIIQKWIRDGSYILMYGGDDIDWIRNFIKQSQSVSCNLFVHVEMVYVGNSHDKDHGCKVEDVIMTEKLSHCLPESSRAYFWLRINSMIASKENKKMNDPIDTLFQGGFQPLVIKKKKKTSDKLLQEILRLIGHEEWALLAKGSTIIGQGLGQIAMTALEDIEKWRTMSLK
ncbi:protein SIEVE ELEMENT OCCLUSION B-like isoform X2 [Silene latifolia]|uniref:protein SIEVE ELEMENT OCCLUSION B-like isoform X2 n=1 Tax=Silene latifolia TaxID=37657 RepID=UPI003D779CF4